VTMYDLIWETRDGRQLPVSEITTDHIRRCRPPSSAVRPGMPRLAHSGDPHAGGRHTCRGWSWSCGFGTCDGAEYCRLEGPENLSH
jgi:hypothetical protein